MFENFDITVLKRLDHSFLMIAAQDNEVVMIGIELHQFLEQCSGIWPAIYNVSDQQYTSMRRIPIFVVLADLRNDLCEEIQAAMNISNRVETLSWC